MLFLGTNLLNLKVINTYRWKGKEYSTIVFFKNLFAYLKGRMKKREKGRERAR